ncbi:MAG TPA: HIT domain-containing protein [Nocardioidaceae bacterium]|nr:HIT domain-containing protein [Nocardioidaceae bacterium]
MADETCLFCGIVSGEVPAEVVAESDLALAFRDINPTAPLHVLVVPRRHCPTMPDLAGEDPASAAAVLLLARQVAHDAGAGDGYRLVCNNGAGAQQTVFHAHAHVLGGRPFTWPPG